jgi:hypothetical protein
VTADWQHSPGDRSPAAVDERIMRLRSEVARRTVSGQMEADTAAMKAQANDHIASVLGDRSDPCAILDLADPLQPADAAVNQRTGGVIVVDGTGWSGTTWTITNPMPLLQPVAQKMDEAFDAVQQIARAAQAIDWDALRDEVLAAGRATAETSKASPRRRHGSAAVCPAHGPARGGTCMTCRRSRR